MSNIEPGKYPCEAVEPWQYPTHVPLPYPTHDFTAPKTEEVDTGVEETVVHIPFVLDDSAMPIYQDEGIRLEIDSDQCDWVFFRTDNKVMKRRYRPLRTQSYKCRKKIKRNPPLHNVYGATKL